MLAPALAQAQSAADMEAARRQADLIQRQEQERIQRDLEAQRIQSRTSGGIDTEALMPKVEAPKLGAKCRDIKVLRISGASHLPDRVMQALKTKYEGLCVGVTEIEDILTVITAAYVQEGYVTTRAYLPAQDLNSGVLEVLVVEGVVDKILLDQSVLGRANLWTAIPSGPGKIFDLRDFEQGLDQLNRLSANNATMEIVPGDEPGKSNVLIRNQARFPIHLNLTFDNQGSETTGRNQVGATVSADGLLGLNEMLAFTHRESAPDNHEQKSSESDSFSASVPLGYFTFSYQGSRSYYASMVHTASGLNLQSRGTSSGDTFKLDYLAYRDQRTRFNVSAGVTFKESRNFFANQFLSVSSRRLTVMDLDSSLSTVVGPAAVTLDLGYAQGLTAGAALRDLPTLDDTNAHAQFEKFKYGLNVSVPFQLGGLDGAVSSQWTGQYAFDTLYSSEQIAIGGIFSVRGFVNNTLTGDSGYYARNEISLRPSVNLFGESIPLRTYLAVDFGSVTNRNTEVRDGQLLGAALGVSGSWHGVNWDVFVSRPLAAPNFMNLESPQGWFRLSYSL